MVFVVFIDFSGLWWILVVLIDSGGFDGLQCFLWIWVGLMVFVVFTGLCGFYGFQWFLMDSCEFDGFWWFYRL